jgi:GntR family transcriptional regulator
VRLIPIEFKAGVPVYEQVLYAARKAIVSEELKPGDPFPSVRALSAAYQINPNTVQKAITALKTEGLIETVPGIGNRVRERPNGSKADRSELLDEHLEALTVRAKQLHLTLEEVTHALRDHWKRL